ncbi:FtsX-like permease family protein [Ectobacillus antri]|uniref:FtsX-like permease family protein n=1 Tax=Ectobacillus antri TaxID=2486280 RepID=A0ABT6H227_9BACI|nr:ABC transporter permease [Ectobacillus antri]MDG4656332.1 FtsX-like permease family protein [Ectobacillus antri]MDG5753007.1 FtsX-like permease family protein [Ectobacillus antri]
MKLKDQLAFAGKNMKKNKLRLFMTIFATTIGCAFLVVLASIGFGIQKSATQEMLSTQTLTEVSIHGKQDGGTFTQADLDVLRATENIKATVFREEFMGATEVQWESRTGFMPVRFSDMKEEKKSNLELSQGRLPEAADEVIVGYNFGKALLSEEERKALETPMSEKPVQPEGYTGELLNKSFTLTIKNPKEGTEDKKEYKLRVVGIGKKPAKDWMQDDAILLPDTAKTDILSFLQSKGVTEQELFMPNYKLYATSVDKVQGITESLKEKGFYVYSVSEELDQMNLYFTIFKIGLIFIGTIAVLIASIGIFNTMTMAVTERTQEIGIMKSLGADPGLIRRLFLMESAFIGIVGSLFGILIAYAVSWSVNTLLPIVLRQLGEAQGEIDFTLSYIPMSLVLIAVGISLFVALVSGFRPALKATRINVLAALRRDL